MSEERKENNEAYVERRRIHTVSWENAPLYEFFRAFGDAQETLVYIPQWKKLTMFIPLLLEKNNLAGSQRDRAS